VRARAGAHKGEAGLVVAVDRGVVSVVGDATRAQFRANARDLTEAVDAAPGLEVGRGGGGGGGWALFVGVGG
jgi:transcription elongation factor